MNFLLGADYHRRLMNYVWARLFCVGPTFILLLTLGFMLVACTGYSTPLPTETALPTRTRRPPDSPLPILTSIPEDYPTDTPPPTLQVETSLTQALDDPTEAPFRLGDALDVPDGGFSFKPVIGYDVNLLQGQASLVSEDGGIVLSLAGGDVPGANALEGVMDRLLATISEDFEKFEASDPYPITVEEVPGLATNVNAELIGRPVAGRVAIAAPTNSHLFYAFAFTIQEPDDRWELEGSEIFEAVISSIHFFVLDE